MDALTAEKNEMSAKLEMLYKTEPVNETMYTIADADIYDDLYGEALGNEPTGNIPAEQEIKITGKSIVNDWYEIEMEGKKQYVSAKLVSRTKPQPQSSSGSSGGSGSSTTQQPSTLAVVLVALAVPAVETAAPVEANHLVVTQTAHP